MTDVLTNATCAQYFSNVMTDIRRVYQKRHSPLFVYRTCRPIRNQNFACFSIANIESKIFIFTASDLPHGKINYQPAIVIRLVIKCLEK